MFFYSIISLKSFDRGNIQVRPKTGEAKFGEWPHVCAILKKELIGEVSVDFAFSKST